MRVLVIGGGGREHALAWKLRQSPRVTDLFCAPGNGGTALLGRNFPVDIGDLDGIARLARQERVDLVVVGPDDALAAGLVDHLRAAGIRAFGPPRAAARMESSKAFAKEFMGRWGIPTAKADQFTDLAAAVRHCESARHPLVLKADGLALGKGVVIARTPAESVEAARDMMERRRFGSAGERIVIEEYLEGIECSLHAMIDGRSHLLLEPAQDHKKAFDGDLGPNTGGMGAFSPPPALTPALRREAVERVLDPFVRGIAAEGIPYTGLLFPGVILTDDGLRVLEFNARFGDPETQVILPRLRSDLVDLLEACIEGRLSETRVEWDPRASVCVVLASGGYPRDYERGKVIRGLDDLRGAPDIVVFHAGTRGEGGELRTSGGRVLGITALGETLGEAREKAYRAVGCIGFDGCHFRKDIGSRLA